MSEFDKLRAKREAAENKKFSSPLSGKGALKKKNKKLVKNPFETIKYFRGMKSEFYATKEWRELRFKVIRESDGKCVYCGRSKKAHDVVIHVDHILPRSKYPELELERKNLQITCEDCNLGKGASI